MSTLKVDNLQTTAGVDRYLASAWVNFNGTGTVAIRGDGNVTSITDNGVGDYTVTYTVVIVDTNYTAASNWGNTTLSTRSSQDGPSILRAVLSASTQLWLTDGAAGSREGDIVCLNVVR